MTEAAERRLLDPEAHIVIVEDDGEMRNLVAPLLREASFRVSTARDGREMWEILESSAGYPDLILLDVMLPEMDGFEICKRLRDKGIQTPVLFLTAKGTSEDRITGLKLGADDYLVKPFHLEELLLRVGILLQRNKKATTAPIQEKEVPYVVFGDFRVDYDTYEITEKDQRIGELGKREVQLLRLLCSQPGKVVSREEILDKIWGEDAFPSSRTIDNYILTFRKYFEKNPRDPRYFHSVRGVGYKFTP